MTNKHAWCVVMCRVSHIHYLVAFVVTYVIVWRLNHKRFSRLNVFSLSSPCSSSSSSSLVPFILFQSPCFAFVRVLIVNVVMPTASPYALCCLTISLALSLNSSTQRRASLWANYSYKNNGKNRQWIHFSESASVHWAGAWRVAGAGRLTK